MVASLNQKIQEISASISFQEKKSPSKIENTIQILKQNNQLIQENKLLKEGNAIQDKLLKDLTMKLKNSNNQIKTLEESKNQSINRQFKCLLKVISQKHLNLCTNFAEQVICLRSDIEKSAKKAIQNKKCSNSKIELRNYYKTNLTPKSSEDIFNCKNILKISSQQSNQPKIELKENYESSLQSFLNLNHDDVVDNYQSFSENKLPKNHKDEFDIKKMPYCFKVKSNSKNSQIL